MYVLYTHNVSAWLHACVRLCICVCVDVCVCLWFESTPAASYNLSSHYHSLALRVAPRLGVVVTLVSISKIIRKAKTLSTGISIHGFITVIVQPVFSRIWT